MIKIQMLETRLGSIDGIQVTQYVEGSILDMDEALAIPWIDSGVCKILIADEHKLPSKRQTKITFPKESK